MNNIATLGLVLISAIISAAYMVPATRIKHSLPVSSRIILGAGFGSKSAPAKISLPSPDSDCVCGSGLVYGSCCEPFHTTKAFAANPVQMVRSRFSALRLKLISYVMETTHPKHKEFASPEQKSKLTIWRRGLETFADEYDFVSLNFNDEVRDSTISPGQKIAKVSFTAKLKRRMYDYPPEEMQEESTFLFESDKWLYSGN